MKAVLLAAGVGSRLRPITEHTPKCMLRFAGRPLIDMWLDTLHRAGVEDVLVNLHHLPQVVIAHLDARTDPPHVETVFEHELLGSAGTLLANRAWLDDAPFFLACNADNLTDFDLTRLVDAHRGKRDVATWTTFRSETPSTGGVVEVDGTGRVVSFVEKPAVPLSNLVNAGMYAFAPEVLDDLDTARTADCSLDIGYHLLPRLVGRSSAVFVDGYFRDIGTVEAYQRAQVDWPVKVNP